MTTNILQVIESNGDLVIDSRLIADTLGIEHRAFMRTVDKYLADIQAFGQLRFENATVTNSVGASNITKFVLLNEAQATFVMTLSRNTRKVIDCKLNLVTAFEKAKSIIREVIPAQNDRLRELELENENLRLVNKNYEIQERMMIRQDSMLTIHGAPVVLALAGKSDQIIERETIVTEVVQPDTGTTEKILTAKQLDRIIKDRTGQKLTSLKWFADELRKLGRDDLLIPVTRSQTSEYPIPSKIDEAIALVYQAQRQKLIGE